MKRAFTIVCTAALVLSLAAAVTAAPPAQHGSGKKTSASSAKKSAPKLSKWQQHVQEVLKEAAPGDEYFGRMKMSYLGINNTFHDDAIRAGAYTTDPRLIGSIAWADEALNAWAKKYPQDPQLARSYFLAFQIYRKVWTRDGQDKAWQYAHIVIQKWPASYFGKVLKKDLAIGFTEHYFATPVACAALSASPMPSASPTPTPTPVPTPAPGMPAVDVLPVPCIAPSPSPLPTSSGSPAPASSASPAPASSASPKP